MVQFSGSTSESVMSSEVQGMMRAQKSELIRLLEARRKFGYRGAALFPLIGHKVTTPRGPGTLLSVFEQHCRVALELDGAPVVFYRSTDLISAAVDESAEKLAA